MSKFEKGLMIAVLVGILAGFGDSIRMQINHNNERAELLEFYDNIMKDYK